MSTIENLSDAAQGHDSAEVIAAAILQLGIEAIAKLGRADCGADSMAEAADAAWLVATGGDGSCWPRDSKPYDTGRLLAPFGLVVDEDGDVVEGAGEATLHCSVDDLAKALWDRTVGLVEAGAGYWDLVSPTCTCGECPDGDGSTPACVLRAEADKAEAHLAELEEEMEEAIKAGLVQPGIGTLHDELQAARRAARDAREQAP